MKRNTKFQTETCWTMIGEAAIGKNAAVADFARIYEPAIRAYLFSRWNFHSNRECIADAVQDIFVECFRPDGVLAKVDSERGSFRAFLFGVVRNVALRYETRKKLLLLAENPDDLVDDELNSSKTFDREYARSIMKEAWREQEQNIGRNGNGAARRLELLELRFHEGLPIREIAIRWNKDAAYLHHQFATARAEFNSALRSVVRFHNPRATDAAIGELCRELIECLR